MNPDMLQDNINYRIINKTEHDLEIPAISDAQNKKVIFSGKVLGTSLDAGRPNAKDPHVTVAGVILKHMIKNKLFLAMGKQGWIDVTTEGGIRF